MHTKKIEIPETPERLKAIKKDQDNPPEPYTFFEWARWVAETAKGFNDTIAHGKAQDRICAAIDAAEADGSGSLVLREDDHKMLLSEAGGHFPLKPIRSLLPYVVALEDAKRVEE